MQQQKILLTEIYKKLESKDEIKVLDAIKTLRESGNPASVTKIIQLLKDSKNEDIQKECRKFLNDLRVQDAAPIMVKAINSNENQKILSTLVSSCWQSRLDFAPFIDTFINIALYSDYLTAYEAFTVIETNISSLSGTEITKYSSHLREKIVDVSEEKKPMIKELIHIIDSVKKEQ